MDSPKSQHTKTAKKTRRIKDPKPKSTAVISTSKSKSSKSISSHPRSTSPNLLIKVLLFIIVIFIATLTIYKIVDYLNHSSLSSSLPTLNITLPDVTIEQIDVSSKDIKYPGNIVTFSQNGNSTTFTDVEFKGRGNSTWLRTAKKPYQIKLPTKADLIGTGKSRKWVLLANFFDLSQLHTSIAYFLESTLEMEYPLHGRFIDFYIDDSYRGLYYLSEKVEISKDRVDLNNPYGIIMEIDNIRGATEAECYYTNNGDCLLIHDSVNQDNEQVAATDFLNTFNELESAIKAKNWSKIQSLIDIDSFAKYFLLNEFLVNSDAYSASFFFYKNGPDDKIHAGPGWDFDLAIGNKNSEHAFSHNPFDTMTLKDFANSAQTSTTPESSQGKTVSSIIFDLIEQPEFLARVKKIFTDTMSGKSELLLNYIENEANSIKDSLAKDQTRWKRNINYEEELDFLIDWVAKRYDHFEQTYKI